MLIIFIAFVIVFAICAPLVAWQIKKRRDASEQLGEDRREEDPEDDEEREDSSRMSYRYLDDRVLVDGDSVWTGVRLRPITDEQLSEDELIAQVRIATSAMQEIATGTDPTPYLVRLTHRPITTRGWHEDLIAASWNPTSMYRKLTARIAAMLEHGQTTRPEVHLMVKIASVTPRGNRDLVRRLDSAIGGVDAETIGIDQITRWHQTADELCGRLRPLQFDAMTREDMLWLIRKPMHGHLQPDPVDYLAARPWGPGEFQLVASLRGRNCKTFLRLNQNVDGIDGQGGEETTYTTFLVAASWPTKESFQLNRAWLRFLARHSEQVEVAMRGEELPAKQFKSVVSDLHRDLDDEIKNYERSRNTSSDIDEAIEQRGRMNDLMKDLEKNPAPGLRNRIVLQLSAPTLDELEDLQREVRHLLKVEQDRMFVRTPRYQFRLLQAMLPGNGPDDLGGVAPFVRLQEAEVFGVGLPNTGATVGDNPQPNRVGGQVLGFIGDYVGTTHDGSPAYFHSSNGPLRDKGGGIASIGGSGGGKSTLALLKFFYESEGGSRVIAIDPKVDFGKFCLYIAFGPQVNEPGFEDELAAGILGDPEKHSKFEPVNKEFWDETQIIDIINAREGALEPFYLTDDIEAGFLLAKTIMEMVLTPQQQEAMSLPIGRAIDAARDRYTKEYEQAQTDAARAEVRRPSMWELSEHIIQQFKDTKGLPPEAYEKKDRAENAASIMRNLRSAPYARLVFSQSPRPLNATALRRTVFTTRGMKLPSKGKQSAKWNETERLSSMVMYLVAELATSMLSVADEPNPVTGVLGLRPKLLFVDEAYAVTSMEQGKDMLTKFLAQGRSYLCATWLIDQQAGRLAQLEEDGAEEATGNQLHTVWAYLQKTVTEAKRVVPLLGRESNPDTATALLERSKGGEMETGVTMMRDADDRAAAVVIDVVFRELLAGTETNPKNRPVKQSVPISSDPDDWQFMTSADVEAALEEANEASAQDAPELTDHLAEQPDSDSGYSEHQEHDELELVPAASGTVKRGSE